MHQSLPVQSDPKAMFHHKQLVFGNCLKMSFHLMPGDTSIIILSHLLYLLIS